MLYHKQLYLHKPYVTVRADKIANKSQSITLMFVKKPEHVIKEQRPLTQKTFCQCYNERDFCALCFKSNSEPKETFVALRFRCTLCFAFLGYCSQMANTELLHIYHVYLSVRLYVTAIFSDPIRAILLKLGRQKKMGFSFILARPGDRPSSEVNQYYKIKVDKT